MKSPPDQSPQGLSPEVKSGIRKRVSQIIFIVFLMGALMFISAGRLDWIWAWIYLAFLQRPGRHQWDLPPAERSRACCGTRRREGRYKRLGSTYHTNHLSILVPAVHYCWSRYSLWLDRWTAPLGTHDWCLTAHRW